MSDKRRIDELNILNALCCLGVLLIHTLSYAVGKVSNPSLYAALIIAPSRMLLFVVPTFLFSSAIKMSQAFCNGKMTLRDYFKYILSRLKKIFIPYLIWNVIYYAVLIGMHYESFDIYEFVLHVCHGTLSAQFYYIVIAFQFYLLLPLWKLLIDKVSPYIMIPLSLIITLLSTEVNSFLGAYDIAFEYSDRIFTSYLVFWIIGLYVGKNIDKFRYDFLNKKSIQPLSFLGLLIYLLIQGYSCFTGIYPFNLYVYAVISYISCIIFAYSISLKISTSISPLVTKINGFLHWVNKYSYSVYLSHCLFLIVTKAFCSKIGIVKILPVTLLCAFSAFIIPFIVSMIIDFLKKVISKKRA